MQNEVCGASMTARLIYGEGAYEKAMELANQISSLIYDFGGDKLSTDDAKEATSKMVFAPIGVDTFCVVVGAVDKARGSATDALLKSIEEHPDFVVPILWANGLDGVPATIRSRCSVEWTKDQDSLSINPKAIRLINAVLVSDYNQALSVGQDLIKEYSSREMLVFVAEALSEKDFSDQRVVTLWDRVRKSLMQNYSISKTEALGVVCI